MQVIRLVDPVPEHPVSRQFLRMLRLEFPELLVHRGAALREGEPTVVLLTGPVAGELPQKRLVVGFSGAQACPPVGDGLVSWPEQRDEVVQRLTDWTGPTETSLSQEPAHIMWVALATRIATRRLHLRSGDEESAVQSIVSLFRRARELMEEHREATAFGQVALSLLNDVLRPYTARWHRWMTEESVAGPEGKTVTRFRDERFRRIFREELRELQPRALGFQKAFAALARGRKPQPALLAPDEPLLVVLRAECDLALPPANLGESFPANLRPEVKLRVADEKGRSERTFDPLDEEVKAIRARRREMRPCEDAASDSAEVLDVAGLALSGGGIRSATFCLGIVQGLQARGLFSQFDYLSTVSGGGYLGTFLSCYLGWNPASLDAAGKPAETSSSAPAEGAAAPPPGPSPADRLREAFERPKQTKDDATGVDGSSESLALRHLRNNSRYLLNGGATGLLRILGVLLTGFATSFIILLTLPLLGAWFLLAMQRAQISPTWVAAGEHVPWAYLGISAVVTMFAVGYLLSSRGVSETAKWTRGDLIRVALAMVLLAGWSGVTAYYLGSWIYPQWEEWIFPKPVPMWPGWRFSPTALGWPSWPQWTIWPTHDAWVSFLDQARANRIWPRAVGTPLAGTLSLLAIYWIVMPLSQRMAQGARWSSPSTRLRDVIEAATLILFAASGLLALLFIAPWLVYKYETIRDGLGDWMVAKSNLKLPEYVTTALTGLATFVFGGLAKRNKGKAGFNWAGLLLFFLTPAFFLLALLVFCSHLGVGGSGTGI